MSTLMLSYRILGMDRCMVEHALYAEERLQRIRYTGEWLSDCSSTDCQPWL
jgi:hypothetical protein